MDQPRLLARVDCSGRGSGVVGRLVQTVFGSEQGPIKNHARSTGVNWNTPGLTWACHTCALEEARNRLYLGSFLVIVSV